MIGNVLSVIIPLAQLFLLWKIYKMLKPISEAEDKKRELAHLVRSFGAMFAEAAEVPKPPKKVVSFLAKEE